MSPVRTTNSAPKNTERVEAEPPAAGLAPGDRAGWTFLTNHLHVLYCIAEDPNIRLRDVATRVGITERATQSIVADLVTAGYLERVKVGRRNQYVVNGSRSLRHPLERHHTVASLLDVLMLPEDPKPPRHRRA